MRLRGCQPFATLLDVLGNADAMQVAQAQLVLSLGVFALRLGDLCRQGGVFAFGW